MNKCYHPFVHEFTEDRKCNTARIENDGSITCMLGNLSWKIKNDKVGWHCDYEKPR